MFQNIRIATSLITIFIIFALLQVGSSSLGFYRAKVAALDFDDVVQLNLQREYLSGAKEALLRARIESNKTVIMSLIDNDKEAAILLAASEKDLGIAKKEFNHFFELKLTSEKGIQLEEPIKIYHAELISLLEQQLHALKSEGEEGYLRYDVEEVQIKLDQAIETFSNHIHSLVEQKKNENTHEVTIATVQLIAELILVITIVIMAMIWLQKYINNPVQNLLNHFQHITDGDLTDSIPNLGRNEIGQLYNYFQKMQQSLINTVSAVRETTHVMVAGVERLAAGNDDLSARTEQQAASLEETAASMEQLTSTVRLNADNAKNASVVANDTALTAKRGGEITSTVVTTMQDISDSSQKIGAITNVIDGIAFQTNILALNAAVEAARAGEQGRGFAVVAGEVRNLAQRSAQAAREIKQLIEDALERVNTGSNLVKNSGSTMDEIVSSASQVNDIIGEISSASEEQSRGIELVSQAVHQMDSVTQQNSSLVNELASSARILEQQASSLSKAVSVFKL
ncbi:methyl-accepting chemotaxis protein [Thorsellia anophelis]|uniref:Methyl-accepting chemotaxis sensory transducer with TarH sensor n=1 Tax=Thorsellia anophelis DSM 18579 TaxID=1123402 RepID=A0A1I0C886_9GAMM|nr:methyl-accepting chemotaxis protein [Thorsellia anophelis]SET15688.1 methyl-accepting chemotaxis sensory transducer with TarH sensor [Thorsellia anophelis DSM 18579]